MHEIEGAFEVVKVDETIQRITLASPADLPPLLSQPTHLYLLTGDSPTLVNSGHPAQISALAAALRTLNLDLGQIERVLYTSWDIGVLGAASSLPGADHFVLSPDMVEPAHYETHIARRRTEFRHLAEVLVAMEIGYEATDLERVDEVIRAYYPPMPTRLGLIPLRNTQMLKAGTFSFEVLAAPGPAAGHAAFYDAERRTLFAGEFTTLGIPKKIVELQPYLISLERLHRMDVDALLLTHELPVTERGEWSVRRALRFLNNFMSTAPAAMHQAPTVVDFIQADIGHPIEDLAEMTLQVERYKIPLDELVRARMIEAEGAGLTRKYGVDIEDDRAPLRR